MQQVFGLFVAVVAATVGYLAFKNRLQSVWQAISGGASAQPAAAAATDSSKSMLRPGAIKYVAGMGKTGIILQSGGNVPSGGYTGTVGQTPPPLPAGASP